MGKKIAKHFTLFFLLVTYLSVSSQTQDKAIFGGIYNYSGVPIVNATVTTQNNKGVITDKNGYFNIKTNELDSQRLLIRSLGYIPVDTIINLTGGSSFIKIIMKEKIFELRPTEIESKRLTAFDNRNWKIFDFKFFKEKLLILYQDKEGSKMGMYSLKGEELQVFKVHRNIKEIKISCHQTLFLIGKDNCFEYELTMSQLKLSTKYTSESYQKRIKPCLFKIDDKPILKKLNSFNKTAEYIMYSNYARIKTLKTITDKAGKIRAMQLYNEILKVYDTTIYGAKLERFGDFHLIHDGFWNGDLMQLAESAKLFTMITNFLNLEIKNVTVSEFAQNDEFILIDFINRELLEIDIDSLEHSKYEIKGFDWRSKNHFIQDISNDKIYLISRTNSLSELVKSTNGYKLENKRQLKLEGQFPQKISVHRSYIYYFSTKGGYVTRLYSVPIF